MPMPNFCFIILLPNDRGPGVVDRQGDQKRKGKEDYGHDKIRLTLFWQVHIITCHISYIYLHVPACKNGIRKRNNDR